MSNKLALKFNQTNFTDFLNKFTDLTSIEDVVKIKFDKETILMYSMVSNESSVLALKSWLLKTEDYIENFNRDETFDFIITSAPKFVKNLKFFNTSNAIKFDIVFKPLPDDEGTMHIRAAQFTSGKMKISTIGGEEHKIRDINANFLESRLHPKNSKWGFKISKEDFSDIKKLSTINNEDKVINIQVIDGKVFVSEAAKWEIEVDAVESKNASLIFGKKYLGNVNSEEPVIQFSVFETFILVKDKTSNLMLSFEQNFDVEDE